MKHFAGFVLAVGYLAVLVSGQHNAPCDPPALECPADGLATCNLETKKCECKPGYTPGMDGSTCYKTFGESCSVIPGVTTACNGGRSLHCSGLIGGTCACDKDSQDGKTFVFDDVNQRCGALSGQLCHTYVELLGYIRCAPNSYCTKGEDNRNRCRCDPGYSPDENLRCIKDNGRLGDSCERNNDCDAAFLRLACDQESKKCQCARGYVLDNSGICVGLEGNVCSAVRPCREDLVCSSKTGVVGTCQPQ